MTKQTSSLTIGLTIDYRNKSVKNILDIVKNLRVESIINVICWNSEKRTMTIKACIDSLQYIELL